MNSLQHTALKTPWGWIGLAGTGDTVHRVLLPSPTKQDVRKRFGAALQNPSELPPFLRHVCDRLERYAAGERVDFNEDVTLAQMGQFHQVVLKECRKIPYGDTCSYGELAARCGRPAAARAVGAAMARNPIPIIIPCHRVLRSDGSLGGFGGGLDLKRRMLQSERS